MYDQNSNKQNPRGNQPLLPHGSHIRATQSPAQQQQQRQMMMQQQQQQQGHLPPAMYGQHRGVRGQMGGDMSQQQRTNQSQAASDLAMRQLEDLGMRQSKQGGTHEWNPQRTVRPGGQLSQAQIDQIYTARINAGASPAISNREQQQYVPRPVQRQVHREGLSQQKENPRPNGEAIRLDGSSVSNILQGLDGRVDALIKKIREEPSDVAGKATKFLSDIKDAAVTVFGHLDAILEDLESPHHFCEEDTSSIIRDLQGRAEEIIRKVRVIGEAIHETISHLPDEIKRVNRNVPLALMHDNCVSFERELLSTASSWRIE